MPLLMWRMFILISSLLDVLLQKDASFFFLFVYKFYLFTYFHFQMHPAVCGILVPWPGIEPTLPALEGRVLTTRPPGKSRMLDFF